MIDRAGSTTAEEMLALHGMMQRRDAPRGEWTRADRSAGERERTVGNRSFRLDGKVVLRPGTDGDPYDGMMDGPTATLGRIYIDYDGRPHLGVTIDDDPMAGSSRDSGRYLFFFADEVQAVERMSGAANRVLVAGIGNAWMRDDAFGGRVAERLEQASCPMAWRLRLRDGRPRPRLRGHARLRCARPRRRQPPGRRARHPLRDGRGPRRVEPIGDGEVVSPHGMDPQTVLRFVKTAGGWPGRVLVIACEPGAVEEMGLELSPAVDDAVGRAVDLVLETVAELLTDAAWTGPRGGRRCMSSRSRAPSSTPRSTMPPVAGYST